MITSLFSHASIQFLGPLDRRLPHFSKTPCAMGVPASGQNKHCSLVVPIWNDELHGMAVGPNTLDVVLARRTAGNVDGNTLTGCKGWVAQKLDNTGALQWTVQIG